MACGGRETKKDPFRGLFGVPSPPSPPRPYDAGIICLAARAWLPACLAAAVQDPGHGNDAPYGKGGEGHGKVGEGQQHQTSTMAMMVMMSTMMPMMKKEEGHPPDCELVWRGRGGEREAKRPRYILRQPRIINCFFVLRDLRPRARPGPRSPVATCARPLALVVDPPGTGAAFPRRGQANGGQALSPGLKLCGSLAVQSPRRSACLCVCVRGVGSAHEGWGGSRMDREKKPRRPRKRRYVHTYDSAR